MQSRTHSTLAALLTVACLTFTFNAHADQSEGHDREPGACHRPHDEGHHGGPHGMHFLHGLDLSEAQQDAIFTLMHRQAPEVRKQEQALHKAQDALRQLSRQEKFDEAQGRRLAREIGEQQSEQAYLHARTSQEVYRLLTPAQRKQVEERRAGTFEPAACRKGGKHAFEHRM